MLETIPNAPMDIIITPSTTNAKSWKYKYIWRLSVKVLIQSGNWEGRVSFQHHQCPDHNISTTLSNASVEPVLEAEVFFRISSIDWFAWMGDVDDWVHLGEDYVDWFTSKKPLRSMALIAVRRAMESTMPPKLMPPSKLLLLLFFLKHKRQHPALLNCLRVTLSIHEKICNLCKRDKCFVCDSLLIFRAKCLLRNIEIFELFCLFILLKFWQNKFGAHHGLREYTLQTMLNILIKIKGCYPIILKSGTLDFETPI